MDSAVAASPTCTAANPTLALMWILTVPMMHGAKSQKREYTVGVREMEGSDGSKNGSSFSSPAAYALEVVSNTQEKFYDGVFGIPLPEGVDAKAIKASWKLDADENEFIVVKAPYASPASPTTSTTSGKLPATRIFFGGFIADHVRVKRPNDIVEALKFNSQRYDAQSGLLQASITDVKSPNFLEGAETRPWFHEQFLIRATSVAYKIENEDSCVEEKKSKKEKSKHPDWSVSVAVKHFTQSDYAKANGMATLNPYGGPLGEDCLGE